MIVVYDGIEAAMEIHRLDDLLHSLGARPRSEPLSEDAWRALGLTRGTAPEMLSWLLDRYAGTRFSLGARLVEDGRVRADIGWILDEHELAEAWDDTRECLPGTVVPFTDDGGGDHVCLDLETGRVLLHVHDAPHDGRHLVLLDESLTVFLARLVPSAE